MFRETWKCSFTREKAAGKFHLQYLIISTLFPRYAKRQQEPGEAQYPDISATALTIALPI